MNKHQVDWSLCVITDERTAGDRSLLDIVRAAIQGGATMIQLRAKSATTRAIVTLGQALHEVTRSAGVPLIINDRIDIALALDAEGVHVGQDDMPAAIARRIMGPDRILGVSAETVAQAQQAARDGADYLGVGTVFATPSKADVGPPIGIAGLTEIARGVALPVVAIGGITIENARSVMEAGAAGLAVISAVVGARDAAHAARQLRQIANTGRQRAVSTV